MDLRAPRAPSCCSRCGQPGHNKRNINCPMFNIYVEDNVPIHRPHQPNAVQMLLAAQHAAPMPHNDNLINNENNINFAQNANQELQDNRTLLLNLEFSDLHCLVAKSRSLIHVPKRALATARRGVTELLKKINDTVLVDTQESRALAPVLLKKLCLFQFVVCTPPLTPSPEGVSWNKHQALVLAERASKLLNDDWSNIYVEDFRPRMAPVRQFGPRTRSMTEEERRVKRVESLVSQGMLSKAYDSAVRPVKKAPATDSTAEKLRDLYPPRLPENDFAMTDEIRTILTDYPAIEVTADAVSRAVKNMAKHVSPGITQWRIEHLVQYIGSPNDPEGARFLEAYTCFVTLSINYKLPNCYYRVLSESELAVLCKTGDSLGPIRPIGMGETLDKVCAVLLKEKAKPILPAEFGDEQVAFIPFGAESAIHTGEVHRELNPDHDTFCGDAKNAFGNLHRKEILKGLQPRLAFLIPYFIAKYGHTNNLWYQKQDIIERIEAAEGGIQGCTMMTLFFSVGANRIFQGVNQRVPSGFSAAFCDDNKTTGPTEEVVEGVRYLVAEGPLVGIELNPAKTTVLIGKKASFREAEAAAEQYALVLGFRPVVRIHPDNYTDIEEKTRAALLYGCVHLGIPVGSPEFVQSWLSARLRELKQQAQQLKTLPDTHIKFSLLYYCFQRKVNYFCRVINPTYIRPFLEEFEIVKRDLLRDVLRVGVLPDYAWDIAKLDLSNGGLGLTDTTTSLNPAYLSSQLAVETYVRRNIHVVGNELEGTQWFLDLARLKQEFPNYLDASKDGFKGLQGRLCKVIYKQLADHVHTQLAADHINFSPRDQATLRSMRDKTTSLWITALPNRDLKLTNEEMQIALQSRLLLDIRAIQPGSRCPTCTNHPFIGSKGEHCGICNAGFGRNVLHNVMRQEIATLASSAGFIAHVEPDGCFPVLTKPEDALKRPDIRILGDPRLPDPLRDLLFDVTVTRPTAQSNLNLHSDTIPGVSLTQAELRKNRKYQQLSERNDKKFAPITFEGPSGRMGDVTQVQIKFLIKSAAERKGLNFSVISSYWMRRLSVKFQKYNSQLYLEKIRVITNVGNEGRGNAIIDEAQHIYEDRIFVFGAERFGY